MNLPNKLTMGRIVLIPFIVILLYMSEIYAWMRVAALVLYILAAVTDWADGHIARKYNLVTNFGKIMDPLADKLLVTAPMLCLVEQGVFPAWCAMLIIAREFMITGLRVVAAADGTVIAATMWGKVKTTVQLIVLGIAVCFPVVMLGSVDLVQILIYVATAITVISGVVYLMQNRKVFH